MLSQHPKLSALSHPVLSLVALYVLTGCDYVSSFYRCTKTSFLQTLIRDVGFICPNGNLMKMILGEFQHIHQDSWVRLVTAVYYAKYKTFFRSKPIQHTFNIICNHPDSPEANRMLSAVQYKASTSTQLPLLKWHEFIRKVTYHVPKVTKSHELKLLPSFQALHLHSKRANYVLKLVLSTPWIHSPFLNCFTQFGCMLRMKTYCSPGMKQTQVQRKGLRTNVTQTLKMQAIALQMTRPAVWTNDSAVISPPCCLIQCSLVHVS